MAVAKQEFDKEMRVSLSGQPVSESAVKKYDAEQRRKLSKGPSQSKSKKTSDEINAQEIRESLQDNPLEAGSGLPSDKSIEEYLTPTISSLESASKGDKGLEELASKGASYKPPEVKKSSSGARGYAQDIESKLLTGIPEYPTKAYEEASKSAAKIAKTEAEKRSKASVLSQKQLQDFQTNITTAHDLQNAIYTDWLGTSEKAHKDLNNIQAKYPSLTRADIIRNMSTGEKITTGLLTALGAAFSGAGDENPAMKVFNRTLDESINQQNVEYDRERQRILTDKYLTDQTFEMSERKMKADLDMRQKTLESGLQIAELSILERSPEELTDIETNAITGMNLNMATNRVNYDMQVYGLEQTAKIWAAKVQLEMGERIIPLQTTTIAGDGTAQFSNTVEVMLKHGTDRVDFSNSDIKNTEEIRTINTVLRALGTANRTTIDNAVGIYNKKYAASLEATNYIPLRPDLRDATALVKELIKDLSNRSNTHIDQNIIPMLTE